MCRVAVARSLHGHFQHLAPASMILWYHFLCSAMLNMAPESQKSFVSSTILYLRCQQERQCDVERKCVQRGLLFNICKLLYCLIHEIPGRRELSHMKALKETILTISRRRQIVEKVQKVYADRQCASLADSTRVTALFEWNEFASFSSISNKDFFSIFSVQSGWANHY